MTPNEAVLVGLVLLLAHLAVLGLSLKLYTEVMKERSQQRRADRSASRCTCGFAASVGGRDPQCPEHGQHRDGPLS